MKIKLTMDGEVLETTLADFLEANADGMEETEGAAIREVLYAGIPYHGGGGAGTEWTLEPTA
jgi:hypothetical protein